MHSDQQQALFQEGLQRHIHRDYKAAAARYDQVLAANPLHYQSLHLRGVLLHQAGLHGAGFALMRRAAAISPTSAEILNNMGLALKSLNQIEPARKVFQQAVCLDKSYIDALVNLGGTLNQQGRRDRAHRYLRWAVLLAPGYGDANINLGNVLQEIGLLDEAAMMHRAATRLQPKRYATWLNLGICLQLKQQSLAAKTALRKALILWLKSLEAMNNLAFLAFSQHNLNDADIWFNRTLMVEPQYSGPRMGLAECAAWRGDLPAAVAHAQKAFELTPREARIESRLAIMLFMAGKITSARKHYEARLKKAGNVKRLGVPDRWQGTPLAGKTLLICSEQGIGDEIMYAADIPAALQQSAHAIIECDPRLETIYRRSFPQATVHAHQRSGNFLQQTGHYDWLPKSPVADFHCAVGSLDFHLSTQPQRRQRQTPYLIADSRRVGRFAEQFKSLESRLLVAISWRSKIVTDFRSAAYPPLAEWAPVFQVPGIAFVSLQYGDGWQAEIDAVRRRYGVNLTALDGVDTTNDMESVFAIAAAADLVLCPSSTVGWIGGALNQETWLLLNRPCYIMRGGDDIPGFPSVQVWGKPNMAPWAPLMHDIAAALAVRRDA